MDKLEFRLICKNSAVVDPIVVKLNEIVDWINAQEEWVQELQNARAKLQKKIVELDGLAS